MNKLSDYYKWELLVIYVKLPGLLFGQQKGLAGCWVIHMELPDWFLQPKWISRIPWVIKRIIWFTG